MHCSSGNRESLSGVELLLIEDQFPPGKNSYFPQSILILLSSALSSCPQFCLGARLSIWISSFRLSSHPSQWNCQECLIVAWRRWIWCSSSCLRRKADDSHLGIFFSIESLIDQSCSYSLMYVCFHLSLYCLLPLWFPLLEERDCCWSFHDTTLGVICFRSSLLIGWYESR